MSQRAQTVLIRQFVIDHVTSHPGDIAALTAQRFRISRQAVTRHLQAMTASGVLECHGKTRSRVYQLREIQTASNDMQVDGLQEDLSWTNHIRPVLDGVPQNVLRICQYGFTEMLNNVIDHSASQMVHVACGRTAETIRIEIVDHGVGIFRKIKAALSLHSEIDAIAELAKGKLTTDPKNHTGEGIFFTSRAFDHFVIMSGQLYFSHVRPNDDWLIENRADETRGTYVSMTISMKSPTVLTHVFDAFVSRDGEFEFSKTHVPVSLLQHGTDNLVSRSQAKRLLTRFERFKEVILDFEGVETIGQAFADEIFRVFQNAHPDIDLIPIHANAEVQKMILRAVRNRDESSSK